MTHSKTLFKSLSLKHEAFGWIPDLPIAQFELGTLRNFVYLILDWNEKKAALVDPQKDIQTPCVLLEKYGFQLELVLLTHSHHDHVGGLSALQEKFPNLPIFLHEKDAFQIKSEKLQSHFRFIKDGGEIKVGTLPVEILHTPGHSAGECSYYVSDGPGYLLTGDTLFIRDCGRTDLETGNTEELFHSLQKIKRLPNSTWILPGHHYAPESLSTLEIEKRTSPPLKCMTAQDLEELP